MRGHGYIPISGAITVCIVATHDAMKYILSLNNLSMHLEAFSSCALSGNRLADVCAETLRRVIMKEPVSDRYLLGLAWTLKGMEDAISSDS